MSFRQIDCRNAPAAGFDLGWTLTIGNQTSQAPVTSYAGPVVDATGLQVSGLLVNGTLTPLSAPDSLGNLTLVRDGDEGRVL